MAKVRTPRPPLGRIGSSGLPVYAGRVSDEWLPALQGPQGQRVYREMSDDDPIIGGILFAIEMLIRQVQWSIQPGSDDAAGEAAAQFIDAAWTGMDTPWPDTLSEILTFLPYGWSLHEICYKRLDDGRVGWAEWAIRGQETLNRWEFDPAASELLGMWQLGPPDWRFHLIPLDKALLFRTTARRGNPEGRALYWGMKIPTPHGWRQIGDLTPGDSVFDEQGRVRYITARADWHNRPCYRLTFNDGTSIVADAAHEWVTQTQSERTHRRPAQIRTTEEIAGTLKTTQGISNHSIPWAGPLDYPTQHLPLSPYLLGLWLGDGHARSMMITCHADDVAETCSLIETEGYATDVKGNGSPTGNGRLLRVYGRQKWDSSGPSAALRVLGLIQNKHIPDAYLRGSIEQRKALLAGLMDSDGTVDHMGRCEFSNTNRTLIDGVAELVRSLGVGVTFRRRGADQDKKRVQDSWGVRFTPPWTPFRLKRKSARIINQHARRQHYIVACEPVEPAHTVCIEVDGPSHLFLAGEAMVPTHNSILRNAYRPWYFAKHVEVIEGIGIERDLAGLPVVRVPSEIMLASATDDDKALFQQFQKIATSVKVDEQGGLVMPSDRDEKGNLLYEFELMSSSGGRSYDTDKIIGRYNTQKAITVLADFLQLGHEQVGTQALSSDKTSLFQTAIAAWLDVIAAQVNRHAIPRLLRLNGLPTDNPPKLAHDGIEQVDLAALGAFLVQLGQAGIPLDVSPDGPLVKFILKSAGLPELPEGTDLAALAKQKQTLAAASAPPQPQGQGQPTGRQNGAQNAPGGTQRPASKGR